MSLLRFLFEEDLRDERRHTRQLVEDLETVLEVSGWSEGDAETDIGTILGRLFPEDVSSGTSDQYQLIETLVAKLVHESGLYQKLESVVDELAEDIEFDSTNRQRLTQKIALLKQYTVNRKRVRETIVQLAGLLLDASPSDSGAEPSDASLSFAADRLTFLRKPARLIEALADCFAEPDVRHTFLWSELRTILEQNAARASGGKQPTVRPTDLSGKHSIREIATLFLDRTPLLPSLSSTVPLSISDRVRAEHMYLVAGSGHGKTQTLQYIILRDLSRAADRGGGFAVVDSQGDLIANILKLKHVYELRDQVVLLDANDIAHPLALNMFDLGTDELAGISPVDREKLLNGTIDLYEYIFSSLLGAELSQKQGVLFAYLARLMLSVPGATMQTLSNLVTGDRAIVAQAVGLDQSTRHFFETQFFSGTFTQTRKQVYTRLLGVLSNSILERMFRAERNKIDMFSAMNQGKIVLINTAKDLLKSERSSIFGRFMIAMIAQAAMARTVLPASERLPFTVYVDEAHEYFDEKLGDIANQARKMNVALVLAHQNLGQTPAALKSTLMTSTSTKLVGGVSATDAAEFAKNMQTTATEILEARKTDTTTSFQCYVRNLTPQSVPVSIPLGEMEEQPRSSAAEQQQLIEANRQRVSLAQNTTPPPAQPEREPGTPEASEFDSAETTTLRTENERQDAESAAPASPTSTQPGKGGQQHKAMQSELARAARAANIGATIEWHLGGGSHVDLHFFAEDWQIACEISVSTSLAHELENIRKCLSAGYEEVWLVVRVDRMESMQAAVAAAFPITDTVRVFTHTLESATAAITARRPNQGAAFRGGLSSIGSVHHTPRQRTSAP